MRTQSARWAFVAGWSSSSCLSHISVYISATGDTNYWHFELGIHPLEFSDSFPNRRQSLLLWEEALLSTFPPLRQSFLWLFSVLRVYPVNLCGCSLYTVHPHSCGISHIWKFPLICAPLPLFAPKHISCVLLWLCEMAFCLLPLCPFLMEQHNGCVLLAALFEAHCKDTSSF